MFATHGTPRQLESDNGPPFQSKDFAEFAEEEGFHHHRVTPGHARANGEAESFMKLLNKTEKIANPQGQKSTIAIQEMLTGFRSTPHPATGVSPYEAMMNRTVRTKLDWRGKETDLRNPKDAKIDRRDKEYKDKIARKPANRNVKEHNFAIGDHVLLKQSKRNKWSTAYEPAFYVVTRVDGSSIASRRIKDGREVYRDASQYKQANMLIEDHEPRKIVVEENAISQDNDEDPVAEETTQKQLISDKETTLPNATTESEAVQEAVEEMPMEIHDHIPENSSVEQTNQADKSMVEQPISRPRRTKRKPAYLADYVT